MDMVAIGYIGQNVIYVKDIFIYLYLETKNYFVHNYTLAPHVTQGSICLLELSEMT